MSGIDFYEILKIIIPQLAIILLVYLFLQHWLKRDSLLQLKKRKDEFSQILMPNRIHAFERMVLFMERISPQNIVPRINQKELTAKELLYLLTKEISEEFEHNLSQQLYISTTTWNMIVLAKDQMIQEFIQAANTLPANAKSNELAIKILGDAAMVKKLSTGSAIDALKKEMYKMIEL